MVSYTWKRLHYVYDKFNMRNGTIETPFKYTFQWIWKGISCGILINPLKLQNEMLDKEVLLYQWVTYWL